MPMTCCPTRTSGRSSTAAKSMPMAIRPIPFAGMGGGGMGGGGFGPGGGQRGFRRGRFPGLRRWRGSRSGRHLRRTVRRWRPAGQSEAGGNPFGQGRRAPRQQKGADIAYRLRVPFVDAATLKQQRITLSDGKTIDLKLPKGVEGGTQMRLKGKGQQGPGGAGDGLVTIAIERHKALSPRRRRCALRPADHAR